MVNGNFYFKYRILKIYNSEWLTHFCYINGQFHASEALKFGYLIGQTANKWDKIIKTFNFCYQAALFSMQGGCHDSTQKNGTMCRIIPHFLNRPGQVQYLTHTQHCYLSQPAQKGITSDELFSVLWSVLHGFAQQYREKLKANQQN